MVDEFKEQLLNGTSLSAVASDWIIDRVPFMFSNDRKAFNRWKEEIAARLEIDGCSVAIVGSASVGFSLNPYKNFRGFSKESDIDIAVISEYHFNICWRRLRNLGTDILTLTPKQKSVYYDHINRLIYWGTIATDRLLPIFDFGIKWNNHLSEISKSKIVDGRDVNIRLYKDFESLRAYHINNLKIVLKSLQEDSSPPIKQQQL